MLKACEENLGKENFWRIKGMIGHPCILGTQKALHSPGKDECSNNKAANKNRQQQQQTKN